MEKNPSYYVNGIPVFIGESYFAPGENVFIQMANENQRYIGVPHKHTFIEIVYIVSGKAVHETQDSRYPVKKGDLVIINCETTHAFYPEEPSREPFNAYDLMFMPDYFIPNACTNDLYTLLASSFLFYSIAQDRPKEADLHFSNLGFTEISDIFKKIYREYRQRKTGCLSLIRAYIIELIIKIFRETEAGKEPRKTVSNRQVEIVNATMQYLHENYSRHSISIEKLASKNYFSKEYFGRIFKSITGMTISSMLQKIRVDEACVLLASTDRKIADIALSCGFGDMKFFYGTFKKLTGMTPGEYRQRNSPPEKILP